MVWHLLAAAISPCRRCVPSRRAGPAPPLALPRAIVANRRFLVERATCAKAVFGSACGLADPASGDPRALAAFACTTRLGSTLRPQPAILHIQIAPGAGPGIPQGKAAAHAREGRLVLAGSAGCGRSGRSGKDTSVVTRPSSDMAVQDRGLREGTLDPAGQGRLPGEEDPASPRRNRVCERKSRNCSVLRSCRARKPAGEGAGVGAADAFFRGWWGITVRILASGIPPSGTGA
jgi:hypothetical protein